MYRVIILVALVLFYASAFAQNYTLNNGDSSKYLTEIVVEAFQYHRSVLEVPAAVSLLSTSSQQRFDHTSLVSAFNTNAGVRMEERSPGSYRLSLRGSSQRSPYGIRNVKVYWNDLPFTDAGGTTYLNLLDAEHVQHGEIIKGPGSSVYGAGTGGAVLLHSGYSNVPVSATISAGSYGMRRYSLATESGNDQARVKLQYAHQESDGYRAHARMVRDAVHLKSDLRLTETNVLSLTALYSDLFYQTPGALTKAQFKENSKQARPSVGATPGSVQQKASIHNQTFYSGASYAHQWNTAWSSKAGVYSSITQFENPTLLVNNYERRLEVGYGGRVTTRYSYRKGTVDVGGEYQRSYSPIRTYQSVGGNSGNLLKDDELDVATYVAFVQSEIQLPAQVSITTGLSFNQFSVGYKRLLTAPSFSSKHTFEKVLSPRVALYKKILPTLTSYASWSKGFSPPTIQELYAADGIFNQSLQPEIGTNLEAGLKGNFFDERWFTEVSVYHFELSESIVGRRDLEGNDYYLNAGGTKQRGVEFTTRVNPFAIPKFSKVQFWTSVTIQDYHFKKYQKVDVDLKGKEISGIAPWNVAAGLDAALSFGMYGSITYQFLDKLPLDDLNTDYANAYHLLGARVGYKRGFEHFQIDLYLTVDNALDETYSLGHDLNAFGGRFYNAAPKRNFSVGCKIDLVKSTKK
jgi:iron complex outermembrane receptor protein